MRRFTLAGLAALLIAPSMLVDGGAMVTPLSVRELAEGAELVVRGRVVDRDVHWARDEHRRIIVSDFGIEVDEVWKGALADGGRRLTVELDGGRIGNLAVVSSEGARLRLGEDVVLFLTPHATRHRMHRVRGAFQGKLTILDGRLREARSKSVEDLRRDVLRYSAASMATGR